MEKGSCALIREQRIQFILEQLNKNGVISIEELKNELKVSRSTIHRDLCDLEASKELQCIRGGAVSVNRKPHKNFHFLLRRTFSWMKSSALPKRRPVWLAGMKRCF